MRAVYRTALTMILVLGLASFIIIQNENRATNDMVLETVSYGDSTMTFYDTPNDSKITLTFDERQKLVDVTAEQQKYIATIEELELVQEVNAETLEFIDKPWRLEEAKPLFWDILKKIIIF
jgi:hypothetical protein